MKSVLPWITRAGFVLILGTCLFAEALMRVSSGHVASILREIQAVFRDPSLQWMIVACLVMYYATFLMLSRRPGEPASSPAANPESRAGHHKTENQPQQVIDPCCVRGRTHSAGEPASSPAANPESRAGHHETEDHPQQVLDPCCVRGRTHSVLSALFVLLALIRYILDYKEAVFSLDALTLLGTIVLGQAVAFWVTRERQSRGTDPRTFIGFMLICLLCIAALWHPETFAAEFAYLGRQRWIGPWMNPNTFGTLMAAGVVLACGMLVMTWHLKRTWPRWLGVAAALCVLGLLTNALARSLSRGAWVAAAGGLAFMGWFTLNRSKRREQNKSQSSFSLRSLRFLLFKRLVFPSLMIVLSLLVLVVLNFRGSDHVLLRRVASIANPNDFSWRNRVASWEGALQMMADKPLLGHGWGATESLYETFYKPARLDTGAAIQMNDYLTIGSSLGLPALAAFVGLIISLARKAGEQETVEGAEIFGNALAGAAVVLAIAFWFDGGLFKLSIAAVFWVCLRPCSPRALL